MMLRPSERLSLAAMGVLALLAFAGRSREALLNVPVLLVLSVGLLALARLGPRSRGWNLARDFWSAPVVIGVFSVLEPIIAGVNSARWDTFFAAVDLRYFSQLASAWRGFLGRPALLTDFVYIAYFSFYLFPLLLAVVARAKGAADFEKTAFAILFTFYVSYAGYFLFPTIGPRLPHDIEAATMGGGQVSHLVRAFLHAAEGNHLDAFPSGHTTVTLVCLAIAWRMLPLWRIALALWTAAIVFATVYVHVHYVVDVVAGVGVMAGVLPILVAVGLRRTESEPEAEPESVGMP